VKIAFFYQRPYDILQKSGGLIMPMTIAPALEEKLTLIATLTNKDKNTVLESLLADRLDEKLRRLAAIKEGVDDIEAGRVVDHEEAMRQIRAEIMKAQDSRA
jgi:predicted transcriptional regulator